MELRQLATFRTVAATLNFTRAAEALGYVQSSVTAQIQALEEELGMPLFDRLGRRVMLTDAGRRLLIYADKMVNLAEEARAAVCEGKEPMGTLVISAPETLCTYRLPGLLREFRTRYPRVRLVLRPAPFSELRRLVAEGALDVAFVLEEPAPSPASLRVEPLLTEALVLIAPPEHPLAARRHVVAADLEGEQMLLTETGCSYRNLFERVLAASGVRPVATLEFSSIEAITRFVMVGMGIAVLPEVTVAAAIAEGRLAALRWAGGELRIETQIIWHKDKWISPALAAFLETARDVLGSATRAA
jgi:DNA-binding transcriptional LysR family regulator